MVLVWAFDRVSRSGLTATVVDLYRLSSPPGDNRMPQDDDRMLYLQSASPALLEQSCGAQREPTGALSIITLPRHRALSLAPALLRLTTDLSRRGRPRSRRTINIWYASAPPRASECCFASSERAAALTRHCSGAPRGKRCMALDACTWPAAEHGDAHRLSAIRKHARRPLGYSPRRGTNPATTEVEIQHGGGLAE